jgi:peptidoglycan/LPS O-acetylase OafA/YrhL
MMQAQGTPPGGARKYRRFLAMIATSSVAMFALMYANTYAVDHVFFSETRLWMTFVMGAAMAAIMLAFMLGMYRDRRKNIAIFVAAAVVFAGALWLVRSQETIADVAYMKAMIPHHSIAILTSERAQLRDPRTRALADGIIAAQRREIAEMKRLIEDIEKHGPRPTQGGKRQESAR